MNWDLISESLNERGYAHLKSVLSTRECQTIRSMYDDGTLYRSTINMERYRFGKGEYKYFRYPLPGIVTNLREKFYSGLVHLANEWMTRLNLEPRFPAGHAQLLERCRGEGQTRPTPLILRYEKGGYNTLHQDLYGKVYFPFQVVFLLCQKHVDFTGGDFVLVEQVPRAQSKAKVVSCDLGDAVIFTTSFRPAKSVKGYYRATVKHGVSEVEAGERYALGIIFHDAM